MSNSTQNKDPIINGEWGSPAPYKVNRWVKKDSTQNDWAKKLSSLIDDTIENRHDYKGSLVVEDDILFERLNENLKLFVTTLLADARREVIDEVEKDSTQNDRLPDVSKTKERASQNDWEKRYEEFITFVTNEKNWIDGKPVWKEYKYVTLANAIMDFIRQELADARREVIEKVEKIDKKKILDVSTISEGYYNQGYNQAISDVLATLREEEGAK